VSSEHDPEGVYKRQGIGHTSGFGARPALLVIDFVNGFADPNCFGGGNIVSAIERTRDLLAGARERRLPIAFTRIVYAEDGSDASVFCRKIPGLLRLTENAPESQIVEALAPIAGELIVRKRQPSAFFATELAAWLVARKVDTLIVSGCTTSGCVRASVIDSMSHELTTVVATDCVGDRALGPHEANLFDMGSKYADLMDCQTVIERLDYSSLEQAKIA
jgi:maleamate amidohydrolase